MFSLMAPGTSRTPNDWLIMMLLGKERIVFLFELVREIPYGNIGKRSLSAVLEQKKGSCSGKHLLLGNLYELLGLKVKYMMGKTNLRDLNRIFPSELRLAEDVIDFHNYLKICPESNWLTVDATFDSALAKLGLPVNKEWQGDKDCRLAFRVESEVEVSDLLEAKRQALASLPERKKRLRDDAFSRIEQWIKKSR